MENGDGRTENGHASFVDPAGADPEGIRDRLIVLFLFYADEQLPVQTIRTDNKLI